MGVTGQPGREPSQEPTVNIGGWLNGPWGLQSLSLSANSKGLWWGRGSQWVPGLGTIVPSNQLGETDARERGHPEPALLPVSDGGWGAGRGRPGGHWTGLCADLGKQNGVEVVRGWAGTSMSIHGERRRGRHRPPGTGLISERWPVCLHVDACGNELAGVSDWEGSW